MTENIRLYGSEPYTVAVVHGGPGAPGEMEPVARALSKVRGVAEPLQGADSIDGQLEELKSQLDSKCQFPVTLIGHSWGAFLSLLFAAKYPDRVKKLILVGSPAYTDQYASEVMGKRMPRLNKKEQKQVESLIEVLERGPINDREEAFRALAEKFTKTDGFDTAIEPYDVLPGQYRIYMMVWGEAREIRSTGELLDIIKDIACPVIAIHGDHDSHVQEGVREPLAAMLKDFRFVLLSRCGHKPWIEKFARDEFYKLLEKELEE